MKSLLVALMVHLLNTSGNAPGTLTLPVYFVPEKPFAAEGEVLPMMVSPTFGEAERRKWDAVVKLAGGTAVTAELCYRSAYNDLYKGVSAMKPEETAPFLADVGGYHSLAVVAVRTCNSTLKKLDILPLGHPEFAQAERAVRDLAYGHDMAYIRACKEGCGKLAARFAAGTVGVPLEAEK